jgi:hypothetical protein
MANVYAFYVDAEPSPGGMAIRFSIYSSLGQSEDSIIAGPTDTAAQINNAVITKVVDHMAGQSVTITSNDVRITGVQ